MKFNVKFEKNLVIELLILCAVLLGMNHLLFRDAILTWNPSPLWLIVLFIPLRHGFQAGLFAGLAAAAIYLVELVNIGHSFQELMHLNPAMLLIPTLFVFIGLYLGETLEHLGKLSEYFKAEVGRLNHDLETNEARRMNLERSNLELQKRIAGQTDTLLGVHANLNRLGAARTEIELLTMLTEIIQTETRADCAAVWRAGRPELLTVTGAATDEIPPLAQLAARKRGVATVSDWMELHGEEPPGAELAALLVEDRDNPVVVTISGLTFGNLNRATIVFFDMAVQRAAAAVLELRHLDSLLQITVSNQELGLSSETYIRNRIREESLLARRHKTELALMSCSLEGNYPPGTLERMEVIVSCAIRASVRNSDGVALFEREKAFVIVLPGSSDAGSSVVIGKVTAHLETLNLLDLGGSPIPKLRWRSLRMDGTLAEDELYRQLFDNLPGSGGAAA